MNRIFPWETGRVDESDTNISFRKIKVEEREVVLQKEESRY